MEPIRPQQVSVLDPIEPSIQRVRLMLFNPFDLSKWFIIGFCAWLAYLGQGGGGGSGFNFHLPPDRHHPLGPEGPDISAAKEFITAYLPLIIIGAVALVIISLIIGIVLCWLRSRGQFMFVHCISGNKAEIAVPWHKFSRHGNSLFLFRIVLAIISIPVISIPVAIGIISGLAISRADFCVTGVAGIVSAVLLMIIVIIVFGLISKFTDDFVVPIMFLQTSSVVAGWKICLAIMGCNKARMVLYILFQILISIVISIIASFICLVGCCLCCSCALLFIPYIGTVILLPLFAFKRSYSLYYLRQFGPQFDVFSQQADMPPVQPMAINP